MGHFWNLSVSFQLELTYYFTYVSTFVPINSCVFLSCRPFVVNTTFSTGLVGVEVSSLGSWQLEFKSLIILSVGFRNLFIFCMVWVVDLGVQITCSMNFQLITCKSVKWFWCNIWSREYCQSIQRMREYSQTVNRERRFKSQKSMISKSTGDRQV